ncbi:MAG: hypothetical protein P4L76_07250 [Beijerinckiaceae bacterium]|nr:hypothetical protein [Beijerinckiaceae bacterium]
MTKSSALILGYHGCDEKTGLNALNLGLNLSPSKRDYDWLGPGIYFWENDPDRALEWAENKAKSGSYKNPYVIGAVIDLRNCLDLTLRENLELLKSAFDGLKALCEAAGDPMPENKDKGSKIDGDKLLRFLDCAVIKYLHQVIAEQQARIEPFDTVRGLFIEGKPLYPGGGFYKHSHTQIAVINPVCIKGVFKPRP